MTRIILNIVLCAAAVIPTEQSEWRNLTDAERNADPSTMLGMTVLRSEDRGRYDCLYVEFSVEEDERIAGYLLVPDIVVERKCPAIIMLHDHGARFDIGKEKLVRPFGVPEHIMRSSEEWTDRYFDGEYFGDYAADHGYVVFVTDALYWGERSSEEAQEWSRLTFGQDKDKQTEAEAKTLKNTVYEGQRQIYEDCVREGREWGEKILHDDMVSADFVASLPYVDENRIGAFGFSMGAHRCWLLSAFSDRIKCGAAVCWMLMKKDYDSDNPSDLSMRITSMRSKMDFPDIAAMLRPKPMYFVSGINDRLFPTESVEKAFLRMQEHYGDCSADSLTTVMSDGGHHCGKEIQRNVMEFFDRYLRQDGENL